MPQLSVILGRSLVGRLLVHFHHTCTFSSFYRHMYNHMHTLYAFKCITLSFELRGFTQNRYSPSEAKSYATVINAARDQPQVVAELFQNMPSRCLVLKPWGRVAKCRGLEGNEY